MTPDPVRDGPSHDPVPDPVRDPWRGAMELALAEAALAPATGDVPVGAVLLGPAGPGDPAGPDRHPATGPVLARAHNEREATGDPTAHAEILALRAASRTTGAWRLTGCTLVVTLEPCTMCAGAAVLSRVARVVYGAADPKAGAAGSLWDTLRDRRLNHRPEVIPGVLPDACSTFLTDFFRTPGPVPPDTDFGAAGSLG